MLHGNGAETVTAVSRVGGAIGGGYAGAKTFGLAGTALGGPPIGVPLAVFGAGAGAFVGADTAEALGEKLTGGPTPDKLGPPLTLPSHLKLEPTVVTAEGDRYALVNVQGKYSWFGINDNPALPKRYIEVVQGAKVAELTRSYLDASGFPEQVERHNAELAEQQRTSLREQFRRSETEDTNSIGPDGQPWGTPTRTAPNATTEWVRSSQPGLWLHTTRIHSGADTEARITQSVDTARWQVVSETVHERHLGAERLVSTTDTLSGRGWRLDRASGQMQAFTLDEKAAAQAREAPAAQNHRDLNAQKLNESHPTQVRQMVQSTRSVCAMAAGQLLRHHQLAQEQLGAPLREHGFSTEQIERVCAAAVGHAHQHAHRGPAHTFLLSRDGTRVAVLQETAPIGEFNVQAALRQSPQQHLERANILVQQQAPARTTQMHAPPEVEAHVMVRT